MILIIFNQLSFGATNNNQQENTANSKNTKTTEHTPPTPPNNTKDKTAKLVPTNLGGESINNLTWKKPDKIKVIDRAKGEIFESVAIMKGIFGKEDWTLVREDNLVDIKDRSTGQFTHEIVINSNIMPLEFLAIGPMGEIEKQEFALYFPDWKEYKEEAEKDPPKRIFFTSGLGLTQMSYSETGVEDISEYAITIKAFLLYLVMPPDWDLGGSVYYTLLPISSTSENKARFLGLNFRFGYSLPYIKKPWRITQP